MKTFDLRASLDDIEEAEGMTGEFVRTEDVQEFARELLTWCVMAYMGNAGERQALQAIRRLLAGVVKDGAA